MRVLRRGLRHAAARLTDLPARIRHVLEETRGLNWRLHDVTITVLEPSDAAAEPHPPVAADRRAAS